MFLELQISILECFFLKDHVTVKTEVMAAENSALPSGIYYFLKYIKIGNNFKL